MYRQPFPGTSERLIWPAATRLLIAAWTVRSLFEHLAASVAIDGQHSPSSLAQSASARSTSFSLSGRCVVQTAVIMRTLIWQTNNK